MKALLVVAHPDDETIFFGGLLMSMKKYEWHVVCVTDGNFLGLGKERQKQFTKACKLLGAKKSWCLQHPDIFEEHLDVPKLIGQLRDLSGYKAVFTHGILGEYGHRHHQDVSYAVHYAFTPSKAHRAQFPLHSQISIGRSSEDRRAKSGRKQIPVYSAAYNIYPEIKISLTPKMFATKTKIFWKVYSGETRKLLHVLPATTFEGFTRVGFDEIETIYRWLNEKIVFQSRQLKVYSWLEDYLREGQGTLQILPF